MPCTHFFYDNDVDGDVERKLIDNVTVRILRPDRRTDYICIFLLSNDNYHTNFYSLLLLPKAQCYLHLLYKWISEKFLILSDSIIRKSSVKLVKKINNKLKSKIYHLDQLCDRIQSLQSKRSQLERILINLYFSMLDEDMSNEGVIHVSNKPRILSILAQLTIRRIILRNMLNTVRTRKLRFSE
jgi:hypothetical protein